MNRNVGVDANPFLIGLNEHAEENVKVGGAILSTTPWPFPAARKIQDVFWAGLFLLTCIALPIIAWMESEGFTFKSSFTSKTRGEIPISFWPVAVAIMASAFTAIILSMIFVTMTHKFTKCVVYMAILFSPVFIILGGVACIYLAFNGTSSGSSEYGHDYGFEPHFIIIGFCLLLIGLCYLACALCCWRSLIPFTVEVLKPVAGVLMEHKSLFIVSLFATVASVVWMFLTAAATAGTTSRWSRASKYSDDFVEQDFTFYATYFGICLLFFWGSMTFTNCGHVTNIGVFGRWYFGKAVSVVGSAKVAFVTSFGSICFGSFIIATIQALEYTVRAVRSAATSGTSRRGVVEEIIIMVVLCVFECLISCIKDIAQAFTYFAYVQVGIRGLSFCDSAKATWALCTFSNVFMLLTVCLVDNVCSLGIFSVSLLSTGAAYLAGEAALSDKSFDGDKTTMRWMNIGSGLLTGMIVSRTFLTILRSGFATICVCYAEDDQGQQLQRRCEPVYNAFETHTQIRTRAIESADG